MYIMCWGRRLRRKKAVDLDDMDGFGIDDDGDGITIKKWELIFEDGDEGDSIKLHKLADTDVIIFSYFILNENPWFLTPCFLQYDGNIGSFDPYFVFIGNEY
ncbi:hypothetical protein OIU85_003929 [Salix viminalis]|uniref:Uncharacterized protein n=1 Tax=Salix viminalis TaxID=40686 RepID=A0A9Q0PRQ7_SALVM|nr:hypothetical protein OIU85_003929 [Salix viminalis]